MEERLIYFDNAATVWPKPEGVYKFMDEFFRTHGVNPGRSGYDLAGEAGSLLDKTRKRLTKFFGGDEDAPERLVFGYNVTDALNLAIPGLIGEGDHLDYHQTMENYFAAKRLLFDGTVYPAPRVAIINAHDPRSERLAGAAQQAGAEVRTYGIGVGDWRAAHHALTPSGAVIDLETPAGAAKVVSRLAGEVNILNLLAALAAAHARGVSFDALTAAVPRLQPVPGRFQSVDAGQPFTVIVDYAHTDDALRNLTVLARQMTAQTGGRVLTLFGCGGDRDRTKRPKMGQAAGKGSDFVVATSDNPRSEEPLAILAAIRLVLAEAKPGDVVLLAGKGHEKEQILAGGAIPFDDARIALSALGAMGFQPEVGGVE